MTKSKVKKITRFDKKDNYGNTSFSIEFENGDKGFYTSKSEDQKKFIIGQESEYNLEEKEGKTGNKYYKITLPQADGAGPWKGGGGKPLPEPRMQMISFAASYTKDLVIAGKVDMASFEKEYARIYNAMISKI